MQPMKQNPGSGGSRTPPVRPRIAFGVPRSFQFRLIVSFVFVSILPFEIAQLAFYYTSAASMRDHVEELVDTNLRQTRRSLDTMLEAYEDFLFQIYTDDEIVDRLHEINAGRDTALNANLLRRRLNGLATTKRAVQCVTIVTPGGRIISYDKLSPTSLESSWLSTNRGAVENLYRSVSERRETSVFAQGNAIWFAESPNYLFHMGHRIIDYRRIFADLGIAFISMDETLLTDVCNDSSKTGAPTTVNFIADGSGAFVSFPDRSWIGRTSGAAREAGYRQAVLDAGIFRSGQVILRTVADEKTDWTIVSVTDLSAFFSRIRAQQRFTALMAVGTSILLIGIILLMTRRLSAAVSTVAKTMLRAGSGDLSVRIRPDRRMPDEIRTIAGGFNDMIVRLNELIDEVKRVSEKQKETEIGFLEAQINPHFLYNTLDSINWMALDHEEYEISDMIGSLARILRYGVDRSNAIVTVADELEWLREYVLLQQIRLKYSFECEISADETVTGARLHKLLLQPFVENAIIHGFAGMPAGGKLEVTIRDEGERLAVTITDNGCGLPPGVAEAVCGEDGHTLESKMGIGTANAVHRLRMYYGAHAGLTVESGSGGTRIGITVPKLSGREDGR